MREMRSTQENNLLLENNLPQQLNVSFAQEERVKQAT
jgi:hypothetical protein